MKNLRLTVPNLTPDLGGAASVLFELGGMVIFHDAAGCCENYAAFDEPRLMQGGQMIYSSSLLQMDAVLGQDEPLIAGVTEAAQALKPRFIVLLGTPVPAVTGMDLDGMVAEIAFRTGIESFAVPTGGFDSYISGTGRAFRLLLERFARRDAAQSRSGVNLLGVTPLDFDDRLLARMKRVLEKSGQSVRACLCLGASLEDIVNAPLAERNIVVSEAGLESARFLEKAFGMPYDVGVPLGRVLPEKTADLNDVSCLVIGERVLAQSLAEALTQTRAWQAEALSDGASEEDMERAMRGHDVIVADPLLRPLAPPHAEFIECPHRALSAHLFEDRGPGRVIDDLLGE